jgi:hypothetical protein
MSIYGVTIPATPASFEQIIRPRYASLKMTLSAHWPEEAKNVAPAGRFAVDMSESV